MPQAYRRSIALGLAHAMLAGPPNPNGLTARIAAAAGQGPQPWMLALAHEMARVCGPTWPLLRAPALAERVSMHPAFSAAFAAEPAPQLRRYILRSARQMPPPLGLEQVALPALPTWGALADWLDLDAATLGWLSDAPARRRYAPLERQHYQWRWWPKPAGGVRLLEVPRARLKRVQRRVLDGLLSQLPAHEAACGFVPGRSVIDHARTHAGQPVLLAFDLRDFFASVHAGRVHALFATLGYGIEVSRALTALVTSRVPPPVLQRLRDDGLIDADQVRRWRSPHLPQGAPTSPALANLCTFALDLRLDALARAMGARYSRYADDLCISGDRLLAVRRDRIEAMVGTAALEAGFQLNHRKTRCATRAGAQRLCGITVNRHPNLPRPEFDRLKAILHRCVIDGPAAQNRAAVADWRSHLIGRVAWACQVNPAKGARLQALLGRIDWTR